MKKTIVFSLLVLNVLFVMARPLTQEDVLSVRNGIYYLDGAPYAEIGWNKFDIGWLLFDEVQSGRALTNDNLMVIKQRQSLKELADAGVKTIRIFGCVHGNSFASWREAFLDPQRRYSQCYAVTDLVMDLCEEYDLRVVYSLFCDNFIYEDGQIKETPRDLIANNNSLSREFLYSYIDEFVERYKNRRCVLAWEVGNELTLRADINPGTRINAAGEHMPTLAQLAQFYKEVGTRIQAIDSLRMVTSGGSILREMAYQLSQIPFSDSPKPWPQRDTYDEHKRAYESLYVGSVFDNIDIHFYMKKGRNYEIKSNEGAPLVMNEKSYNQMCEELEMPMQMGEYGALPKVKYKPDGSLNVDYWTTGEDWFETFGNDEMDAQIYVQQACDRAVDSGCRLIFWWCYDSHRPQDQNDPQRMDLDVNRTPLLFQKVIDANRRLQQKYNIQTSVNMDTESKESVYFSNGVIVMPRAFTGAPYHVFNMRGEIVQAGTVQNSSIHIQNSSQPFVVRVNGEVFRIL